jgi:UDP-2,3-diacylglucosamine hydrolase
MRNGVAATLFISDLHLDPARPVITDLFIRFLRARAAGARALYILGDLFEVWVGDDDTAPLGRQVSGELRSCALKGTAVYLMHGNRDFLIGAEFIRHSGCSLLDDPAVIDLYGERTLLMHGDTLCTDDTAYQSFREMVRDSGYQRSFLSRPLDERRRIAGELRQSSREAARAKPEAIMDVNLGTVEDAMRAAGTRRLIHGHTHRPAIHEFLLDGLPAQRIVLGDWYEQGSLLECDATGMRLQRLPRPEGGSGLAAR